MDKIKYYISVQFFKDLWKGDAKLWEAFWIVGVFYFLTLSFFYSLIGSAIVSPIITSTNSSGTDLLIFITILNSTIKIIFSGGVFYGVVKCSKNTRKNLWRNFSRIIITLFLLKQVTGGIFWMYNSHLLNNTLNKNLEIKTIFDEVIKGNLSKEGKNEN